MHNLKKSNSLSTIAYNYNSGLMNMIGASKFCVAAGTSHTYPTNRCAIIIPIQGYGTFQFDHETFHISKGIMLHGCPNRMLTITADSDFEYINLYYNGNVDEVFAVNIEATDRMISILDNIVLLNKTSTIKNEFLFDHYMNQFFELLFSDTLPTNILSETDLIKNILDFIHNNYASNITLAQISAFSGESISRIEYLFRKHLGKSPVNYLIDYRLKISVNLLNENAYSIDEVSGLVGYNDPLYFSRIFKKRLGFPPSLLKYQP